VQRGYVLGADDRDPPRAVALGRRRASIHNCRGLCGWCHDLVHYHGYTLEPNDDDTFHLRAPP
jgi:hypothetical protein